MPCPVCHRAQLQQVHGVVCCPAEGWQLDVRKEGGGLDFLQHTLAATYQVHLGLFILSLHNVTAMCRYAMNAV